MANVLNSKSHIERSVSLYIRKICTGEIRAGVLYKQEGIEKETYFLCRTERHAHIENFMSVFVLTSIGEYRECVCEIRIYIGIVISCELEYISKVDSISVS